MYEEIEPMGAKVMRILDIKGTKVTIIRKYPEAGIVHIQGFPGMPLHLNDHIKTDKNTQVALECYVGGRVGIGPDYEAVVVSKRGVKGVGGAAKQVYIKAGRVWAKINKTKRQLQIETNGGVIGIEG